MWVYTFIDVTVVARSIQLSRDGKVIWIRPVRHDVDDGASGAFANPDGHDRGNDSAIGYVS
jgi:hypothetical protein